MRLAALALGILLCLFAAASAAERITDILGRSIDLSTPPQRVVLGDSLDFIFLSLLLDDPVAPIVGWAGADRIAASLLPLDRRRFPEIDRIASLGDPNAGGFSVEAALALKPDVAVLGPGYAPGDIVVRQLERAGVAVVFIGAASDSIRRGRREITGSMRILGEMFGKADRAAAFNRLYDERMDRIEALVAGSESRPSVLVEAHANGADCCWSPGSASDYVAFAGGRNIADGIVPGATGQIGLEYVLLENPDVLVMTGGSAGADDGRLQIGPTASAAQAKESLGRLAARRGFAPLGAVMSGRVHGIWHPLLASPLNVVGLEAMAVWFHPDLADRIDPQKTLAEVNARFASYPFEGIYWVGLSAPGR